MHGAPYRSLYLSATTRRRRSPPCLVQKASGQASLATGVDSGLEADVMRVHAKSMGANQSLQVGGEGPRYKALWAQGCKRLVRGG